LLRRGISVILHRRPHPNEVVTRECFGLQAEKNGGGSTSSLPAGTLRCRTLLLSVDPFLRCRFNEETGVDYTAPFAVGEPISSAGIGQVLQTGPGVHGFRAGDLVLQPFDAWPWSAQPVLPAQTLALIPVALGLLVPPSALLNAVGQPGLTAYCGVEHVAMPSRTDIVVVSGAAGAVGSLACQLFRRRGCRAIGLCGSDAKAEWLLSNSIVNRALNYKQHASDLHKALAHERVSLYWDNAGGAVSDAVICSMSEGGRILLCGQISMYNTDEPYPPPLPPASAERVSRLGISRQRYLLLDHAARFPAALAHLCELQAGGQLLAHETRWGGTGGDGVASAPEAFLEMMRGENTGKAIVEVAPMPAAATVRDVIRHALPAAVKGRLSRRLATRDRFEGVASGGGQG
jgi:prostaglandin reductase 2